MIQHELISQGSMLWARVSLHYSRGLYLDRDETISLLDACNLVRYG